MSEQERTRELLLRVSVVREAVVMSVVMSMVLVVIRCGMNSRRLDLSKGGTRGAGMVEEEGRVEDGVRVVVRSSRRGRASKWIRSDKDRVVFGKVKDGRGLGVVLLLLERPRIGRRVPERVSVLRL